MASPVILDTSIFVGYLRDGEYKDQIERLDGLVRTSAVVLAELLRAAKAAERSFLQALQKNHPVLVPTEQNWLASGELLSRMRADHGFSAEKLRSLHFDVLIALTARSRGARLITANRADFELIKSYGPARGLSLEIW